MTEEKKTIKIQYCEGESGWAEEYEDGLYKIANTPALAKDLRWGDIVRIDEATRKIKEVVKRQLPHSAKVFYKTREVWPDIVASLRARYKYGENISVEGGYPPNGETEGMAGVNFNDEVDLKHAIGQFEGVRIVHDEDGEES